MSQLFTGGVGTLNGLTESKPCLWDKMEKSKAWRKICAFLEGDFHQMDTNKKQHKIFTKKQHKISKYTFINTF
jgi:hypothetical protein